MALASNQKVGVNINYDRTTLDAIKDSDGDALRNALYTWKIVDQDDASATFGQTKTCAFLVNVNGTPVGEGYINLGIGTFAVTTAGALYIKTAAAGTDTWVLVTAV